MKSTIKPKQSELMSRNNNRLLKIFATTFFATLLCINSHAQIVEGVDYSNKAYVYKTFDMYDDDVFGHRFPSENFTFNDKVTGVTINALTTSRNKSSKMYQTHPQWTPDGKYVIFTSNRKSDKPKGDTRTYALSMKNFEIVQISSAQRGSTPHLGWHKNLAYQFRGNNLIEIKLRKLLEDSEAGKVGAAKEYEQVLGQVPDSIRPSGMGLDANENRIFFSSRINEKQWAIFSINFTNGKTTKLLEVPIQIGHLQANPYVSGEIMYCWETGGDSPQRMWYMTIHEDGNVENRPIYEESENEWVTHEVFMGPDHILFHVMGHLDRLQTNQTGLYSFNIRTNEPTFHGQTGGGGYWHCNATSDRKWIVADTFDGKLFRLNTTDKNDVTLLTQGHRLQSISPFTDEAHLHPSLSPDGKWILINSSILTESDIMLVPLFPEE